MLKLISRFYFKHIEIDHFIIKQNTPTIDNNSSSPLINEYNESSNHSFIPISFNFNLFNNE